MTLNVVQTKNFCFSILKPLKDRSHTFTGFIADVIQPYVSRYLVDKICNHYAGNYDGAIMFQQFQGFLSQTPMGLF